MKTQIHDYTMEVFYKRKLSEINFVFEIEPYWGGNYNDPPEGGYAEISFLSERKVQEFGIQILILNTKLFLLFLMKKQRIGFSTS
jgi:hypothetical protein